MISRPAPANLPLHLAYDPGVSDVRSVSGAKSPTVTRIRTYVWADHTNGACRRE